MMICVKILYYLGEWYADCFNEYPEIGHDFNPIDAGWLCGIQQRFGELYHDKSF